MPVEEDVSRLGVVVDMVGGTSSSCTSQENGRRSTMYEVNWKIEENVKLRR